MYRIIYSADFMRYNANSAGRRTDDCVKRSIATAFGKDYNEVSRDLISAMKASRASDWKYASIYNKVIQQYGGSEALKVADRPKLGDFIDSQLSEYGTYIVTTGSNKNRSNHVVAVIDGEVYDTWDSRNQYVFNYYIIKEGKSQLARSNLDITEFSDLIRESVFAEVERLSAKYDWAKDCIVTLFKIVQDTQNSAQVIFELTLQESYYAFDRSYRLKFGIALKLTDNVETAEKRIRETVKIRVYDRMWSINQQEAKLVESHKYQPDDYSKPYTADHHLSSQEQRFYNSLPGWVIPRVKKLSVTEPNKYHDSYDLYITPLTWDTNDLNAGNTREFWGYTSAQVKDMLDRYKNKHEIPSVDYDVYEEY